MSRVLKSHEDKKKDKAVVIEIGLKKYAFCLELGKNPYLINLNDLSKVMVKRKEKVTRWDYVATFKPPAFLSIE